MQPYDSRPITLDPGLTLLALRAKHEGDTGYPFVQPTLWGRILAWLRA